MRPEDQRRITNDLVKELKESNEPVIRESVAKMKDEIREAIEKDALTKQIIDEITPRSTRSDGFFKHPATLLVLGFIFTTALGGILTSCWKGWELDNERSYLATQTRCERERQTKTEEIKQKIEVKDEIIKRVAETNTAAEEILLYFGMEPSRQERERDERIAYWKEATRAWKTNEKILNQRLQLRFSNPDVARLFEDMVSDRSLVGIAIDNEHEDMAKGKIKCNKRISTANECMIYITTNVMPQVIKMMNQEILLDESSLRAAKCVDYSVSNVNVTPGFPVPSRNESVNTSNCCPEPLKILKLCECSDTSQTKSQNSSELENPCPNLRGMTEKCETERESAAQGKPNDNGTQTSVSKSPSPSTSATPNN